MLSVFATWMMAKVLFLTVLARNRLEKRIALPILHHHQSPILQLHLKLFTSNKYPFVSHISANLPLLKSNKVTS